MSKQEIIEKLSALLEQPALSVQKEIKAIEKEYKKIWTEEFEKAKQAFIDEGGKAKDFVYTKSKEDEEIVNLLNKYEKKKADEENKLEQLRQENKAKKEELIKQLELLAEADVKDITAIVKKLREIQGKWKEIKELAKKDYAELQRKYNVLLDKINENIKAFDTLQQYDLQKNTELKEELLKKLEALLDLDDFKKIDELWKVYKKEWNQIGNVVSEKYGEIRESFNELNKKIKEKLDTYFAELEAEKQKNLELKNKLLAELKSITEQLKDEKSVVWKDINEKIQKLKSEWEKIGHIPAELVNQVNKEYNALLDIYYDAKRKHFEEVQKKQEEIRAIKEKILAEVQALTNSKEFNEATKKIIQLQQEWKRFYLRNKEENDKLNQLFKSACDAFFENKKNYDKEKIQEEKDNLVKKLELIHRIKEYQPDKNNPEASLQQIQEFIKEWNSIGHVPIEEKDKVHDDFFGRINHLYAELDLSEEKRHAIQYKAKIQQLIQSSSNPLDALTKEEKFIRKKISELKNEITQVENNLAFFKNAKSDNPLLKEAFQKKEKLETYLQEWTTKLNIIQSFIAEYKKAKQTTQTEQ
ncbi:MAG TPA: DUF349 domain-containing protein [Bacteroidia bacterium]|nr:DUF349 domain-containing protein [Bacteroidia bacterium]